MLRSCQLFSLVYALRDSALFPNMCEKKAAHERRPESREETPKEASAAAMLHCNNDSGINFVQQERQIFGLPLFFAKLRDFGASLSTAPRHWPTHSSPTYDTTADRPGSSKLSSADPTLQPEECRKPMELKERADHI